MRGDDLLLQFIHEVIDTSSSNRYEATQSDIQQFLGRARWKFGDILKYRDHLGNERWGILTNIPASSDNWHIADRRFEPKQVQVQLVQPGFHAGKVMGFLDVTTLIPVKGTEKVRRPGSPMFERKKKRRRKGKKKAWYIGGAYPLADISCCPVSEVRELIRTMLKKLDE